MAIDSETGEFAKHELISLGTLFTVWSDEKETAMIDIVLDVGENGGDFESAQIHRDGNKVYFGIGGSRGPKDFGKKVGQLSFQEVIGASQLGAKKKGIDFTGKMYHILMKYAQKGKRTLEIRR